MNIVERATWRFRSAFGQQEPEFVVRAPGRVNLLGAHTDYNDGWVLPAAIDRAAYVAVGRCPSRLASIVAADLNDCVTFRLAELEPGADLTGAPLPAWARYPAGVALALQQRGLTVSGMDAVLASTVPVGAGLSSSAAVEMAFAVAWQQLGGWPCSPMELALACKQAENEYVGVNCGLMDQFASAHGRAGHALLLDCRTLEWEALPLPDDVAIVVADTGVRRELGLSEYNRRRAACEEAVRILQRPLPHIRALRDVTPDDLARHEHMLSGELRRRARHVVEEIARTHHAVEALRRGDVAAVGRAMNESHRSSRDLYEVSIPQLDMMAQSARELDGCFGARLTGAGFGGCVVALVAQAAVETFAPGLARRYAAATGIEPHVYVCRAADCAQVVA